MLNLQIQNFRGLRTIDWTIPKGVSALVGPNGSGKSTLLGVLEILQLAPKRGLLRALEMRGGVWGLRTIGAPDEEPVQITIANPERTHRYNIRIVLGGLEETITLPNIDVRRDRSGEILLGGFISSSASPIDKRLLPISVADSLDSDEQVQLIELMLPIKKFRLHDRYLLDMPRKSGSELSSCRQRAGRLGAHPTGRAESPGRVCLAECILARPGAGAGS